MNAARRSFLSFLWTLFGITTGAVAATEVAGKKPDGERAFFKFSDGAWRKIAFEDLKEGDRVFQVRRLARANEWRRDDWVMPQPGECDLCPADATGPGDRPDRLRDGAASIVPRIKKVRRRVARRAGCSCVPFAGEAPSRPRVPGNHPDLLVRT